MTTVAITIRNFTGKPISLDIDPASKVSDVKDAIARVLPKTTGTKLALACKGHELRDHQSLSHYDITSRDILHICEYQFFGFGIQSSTDLDEVPPSKVPKVILQFEKPDGHHFILEVNTDITVAQLKRDIEVEEKIDVPKLNFVSSLEDPEDPEILMVSDSQDLSDEELISRYPLSNSTIFVCRPSPPHTPSPTFNVVVRLHDGRKLDVEAKLQQTLNEFRKAVQLQHNISIADDVLIVVGKEVVGEEIPIWDLGFAPNCTIHAGEFRMGLFRLRRVSTFYVPIF
jgi:Ubiquitin family